jgi:hypothetical protein
VENRGLGNRLYCTAKEAKDIYFQLSYEDIEQGIERVPNLNMIPWVLDPKTVLSEFDYDLHNTGNDELAIRASFQLMPDNIIYRIREGYVFRSYPDPEGKKCLRCRNLLPRPVGKNKGRDTTLQVFLNSRQLLRYNLLQSAWMNGAEKFFEAREHHHPEVQELIHEYFGNKTPVYFKIRDVLLNPNLYEKAREVIHLKGVPVSHILYGDPEPVEPSAFLVAA